MNSSTEARRLALEALTVPPPVSLFEAPIEYLFAEHFRHRTLCNMLEQLAVDGRSDEEDLTAMLAFLETDFDLHLRDEEEDLYALMRMRATPEDRIEELLATLKDDHMSDHCAAGEIIDVLRNLSIVNGRVACPVDAADLIRRFAKNERRHLTRENAIVLPLARARLTASDLTALGQSMAARRGITLPETENAV
ncbi:hemerythrin domain-containing protein [Roseibium sp.]|uniref:hemerythrin domain-containing protein n=1 Tax=Roseibium sp. TaxID=1936156 RepID=UPI003A970D16